MSDILFTEVQRFRQPWIWVLLFAIQFLFIWGLFQQLVLEKPWGNRPASDTGMILLNLIPLALIVFMYLLQLQTTVTVREIHLRFYPLTKKTIPWEEVERAYIRTYKPIREFGGWGIRLSGSSGKAYTVSGNTGLQIHLANGKKFLVGTQQPRAWEAILKKVKKD